MNAFPVTASGHERFHDFLDVAQRHLRCICGLEVRIHVRTLNQLEDVVLTKQRSYQSDRERLERFSLIDIVLIAGSSCLLPWMPRAASVLGLVHQCLLSQKPLFGDIIATQLIWYLVATHGQRLELVPLKRRPGQSVRQALAAIDLYSVEVCRSSKCRLAQRSVDPRL